ALGIGYRYSPAQTPVMLTISADNDTPRKDFFPFGRHLGEWLTFSPQIADSRERELERRATAFAPEQVTHRMEPTHSHMHLKGETHTSRPELACAGHDHCEYTWYDWTNRPSHPRTPDSLTADEYTTEAIDAIRRHDFSAETILDEVVLKPTAGNIPNQAL